MGFDLERVLDGVVGTRFRGAVRHSVVTGSTSTLAMEAALAGAGDGLWVADAQTAGRGRGGHGWHSAAGDGLYCSALVRLELRRSEAMMLPLAMGVAARTAVEEVTGLIADLRWPNDLLLGGRMVEGRRLGAKKFGGILVETSAGRPGDEARVRFAVIGVGINVNHAEFPEHLHSLATSLRMEGGGAEIRREALLIALLRAIDGELDSLAGEGGVEKMLARFAAASSWVAGKPVRVGEGAESYVGVTRGLTPEGFLRVLGDDGAERTVLSGGVRELDA